MTRTTKGLLASATIAFASTTCAIITPDEVKAQTALHGDATAIERSNRWYADHRDRLQGCMTDLRNMPNGEFKRWCLQQSKRLP